MPYKFLNVLTIVAFACSLVTPIPKAHAESLLGLPEPGAMVNLSPAYEPILIKGLKVHPENPFLFDFILDTGDRDTQNLASLRNESAQLIKYFLTAMTVPEKDLWVNLSPYEKKRMIASNLAQTEMGRDMLAQDYILKQLTASLIYPERDLGKTFWDEVYSMARQLYGTTAVPVNTFNKVWIVADKADVYEHDNTAYVVGAHLKVMLEEDYLALYKHRTKTTTNTIGSQIVRAIILPQLEKEVNQGRNFAPLRQMFYAMILASWYKTALKDAILTRIYGNQSKVRVGVNQSDPRINQEIFNRYLRAYKKGVFNYIKEDINTANGEIVPRKYFSGGEAIWQNIRPRVLHEADPSMLGPMDREVIATVKAFPVEKDTEAGSQEARQQETREELKTFGFSFTPGLVSWDMKTNQHAGWKPMTQWSPRQGSLEARTVDQLPVIQVQGMVPYIKASHQLFLSVSDIQGQRRPVVIKQYYDNDGHAAYYAMGFVPGRSIKLFDINQGRILDRIIDQQRKINAFFIYRQIHPPEEFIDTPEGDLIPIDAQDLYSYRDDFQVPNEEPAREYILSQLGGPPFYGLVKFKTADAAMASVSTASAKGILGKLKVVERFPSMVTIPGEDDLDLRVQGIRGQELDDYLKWFRSGQYRESVLETLRREAKEEFVGKTSASRLFETWPKSFKKQGDISYTSLTRVVGNGIRKVRISYIVATPLTEKERDQSIERIKEDPLIPVVALDEEILRMAAKRDISIELKKFMGYIPVDYQGRRFVLSNNVMELFKGTPSELLNSEIKKLDSVQVKIGVFFRITLKIKGHKYYLLELDPKEGVIKPLGGAIQFKDPAMSAGMQQRNGGIDLNARHMQLTVRRDSRGLAMPFDAAQIERMNARGFDGLEFNIQSIVPATNLHVLLGLELNNYPHHVLN